MVGIAPPSTTWVWASFDFIGLHHWPQAPHRRLYLRASHRHLFKVRASVSAAHDDREVECHDLLEVARAGVPDRAGSGEWTLSCEQLATAIATALRSTFGAARRIKVSVSEDGEVGAELHWEAE